MSESQLVTSILEALQLEPGIHAWRNNTGAIKVGKRYIRYGSVGSPDILAIVGPEGRLLGIECKAPGGKQGAAQQEWEGLINGLGGVYCLAKSVAEARKAVQRARGGGAGWRNFGTG